MLDGPLLSILFEDQYLVAVDKPAGLPSQPIMNSNRPDLFSLLKKQLSSNEIFLHHRLDKDTTGVVLFSKRKSINGALTEMFRQHQFTKTYCALTKNNSAEDKNFSDKIAHGWRIENHLVARRKNGSSVKMFRTESGGDHALTDFKILAQSPEALWIQAQPQTGRTHQIRVHLLHSGHPILGDSLYGGKDSRVPRMMLHAQQLSFAHPANKKPILIQAPLPADFQGLLKNWNLTPQSN